MSLLSPITTDDALYMSDSLIKDRMKVGHSFHVGCAENLGSDTMDLAVLLISETVMVSHSFTKSWFFDSSTSAKLSCLHRFPTDHSIPNQMEKGILYFGGSVSQVNSSFQVRSLSMDFDSHDLHKFPGCSDSLDSDLHCQQ
jgi:hypothetical protein